MLIVEVIELTPRSTMRSPTTQWVALNLLRLTAVVFLVWALVAQFIMLAR